MESQLKIYYICIVDVLKLEAMTVNNMNSKVNLSLDLSFYKQLLKLLSLEQMQAISSFLSEEIHHKIKADRTAEEQAAYNTPLFTVDMMKSWDEEVEEEDGEEMSDEEFYKAVQEMS